MGFEIFKEDEERPGFSVVTDTPRNSNLATGMAGTTLKRYIAPNTTSVADFRKLDEKSAKMEVPKYTPPSGAVKRFGASTGIGLIGGLSDLNQKRIGLIDKTANFVEKAGIPIRSMGPDISRTSFTPQEEERLKQKAGLKGTMAEQIGETIGHEIPAVTAAYLGVGALSKGSPAVSRFLTGAGKWTETGRRGVAAGALYTPIAEENPELKDYLENMALFGVGDVAFMGAAHGLGKGFEKLKGFKKAKSDTPADFDFLVDEGVKPEQLALPAGPEPIPLTEGTNWRTPSPYETFTALEGQKPMALPAGHEPLPLPEGYYPNWETPTPYQTFLALEKQKPLKIAPGEQPKMLGEGYYPDWEYGKGYPQEGKWFVDSYGNVKDTPGAIKALPEGTNKRVTGRNLDDSFVPRSDIGDPAYLGGLAKRYNEIIDAEVTSMKNELGGVQTIGKNPYELQPGQELFEGYERVSLNPSWYREWWQKHLRAPREGEWRDLAIKNLMEGNPETGEPANEEFLAILSELSRGQKLPEEWHGLQRTIRDLEGSKGEYVLDNAQRQEIIDREYARRKQNDYDVFDDYVEHFPYESEFLNNFSHLYYKKPYYNLTPAEKLDIDSLAKEYWKGEGYYGIDSPDAFYGKEYDDALYKFGGGKEEQPSDIDSLLADMRTEQAKVEPYGLTRDLGRLDEAENTIRSQTRMADDADFGQYEEVKFKYADSTAKKAVSEANRSMGIASKEKDRITYAADGWTPEIELADKVANALSGTGVIPVKMPSFMSKVQGFFEPGNKKIFLNSKTSDPATYVTMHETVHRMATNYPEHFSKMQEICVNNLKENHAELIKRYQKRGYSFEEMPEEFTSDVIAEMLHDKSFIGKLREQAPEIIQPLLKVLDEVIAKVKLALSKDDSVLPFIENLERLRNELAPEYKSYMESVGKHNEAVSQFKEGIAAKQGNVATKLEPTDTPEFKKWFGDWRNNPANASKVVDEAGKPLAVYHGTKGNFNIFKDEYRGTTTDSDSSKLAIYFTDAKNVARTYADEALSPRARKEYVDYRKNMDLYDETGDELYKQKARYHLNNYSMEKGYGNKGKNRIIEAYLNIKEPLIYDANGQNGRDINIADIVKKAKQDGNDGVILKNIDDPAQDVNNGISDHYIVFNSNQVKSVKNRGTFDANNPNIRYKLGEGGKSIVDDLKAMITFGAEQLHKGGYKHFAKLIKQQFPEELKGYSPEVVDKLINNVRLHAKQLRDTGETQIAFQGKKIPVKREIGGKSIKPEQAVGDMGDIDTRQHIVSKAQREPIIAKEVTKKIYTKAVDDLYHLDELDRFVAKTTGKHLPTEDKAYLLAINSRESTGAARAILEENLVDAQGNIIGQSFKEVLNKIPRGKEQDFRDYLVLRNSISWMEQGKKVYPEKWKMTPERAMQRLAAYDQQTPELKQAADEYVKWHRDMAQAWLVDTGIITPEAWQAFLKAHPYYTPFQRQMKPIETTPGQGKARRGFANQTNPTKKAEGSERPIIDPIESTIEQVDRYIKTAKRNEVMQAVIRNLEKAPGELEAFAEVIPEKGMDALDNIDAILGKDGIDGVINYLEEPFEQMIARKGKAEQPLNKPNIVRAFVDGERVHVKVNDPVLLDALTALSDTGRNAIVESFRTATRLMKILTTGGNPIFAARNIARDVPMAYVASETLSKTPIVREAQFAWGMVDALARILTNEKWHPDKFYREYKAMGGGSHTASVAADRNILAESKSKVMPGYWRAENNNPLSYLNKSAKTGFQGIERFTSTVEALPRLPEYIRTVKKGGNDYASKLEGLHASQDVTVNFSRRGDISKDADAFIPYFNAAVQGIEKIARMFGKDPLGATYRSIVAVTVPTIGLYLLNKDNPNYHKLSSFVRDNYYCLPIQNGEKFIKIAKPREIGVMFSDLPERALRQWEADDPEGFYQFSEAWINNFVPPIRPIVMPLADVLANKDFAGRPIVPGYLEGLSPELQYDEKTSAAAKALGKSLKLSPKQIDYLFRSFTGVVGELGIPAMAQGTGQSSGQRVGEVLKRSFTADPLYSNDVTSKFYEEKELLDKAAADYKATGVKSKYYNPTKRKYYNRQAQRISNIRKEIRKVNANPNLSYEEKEERTRRMQANILKIAQKGVKNRFSPIVTAR